MSVASKLSTAVIVLAIASSAFAACVATGASSEERSVQAQPQTQAQPQAARPAEAAAGTGAAAPAPSTTVAAAASQTPNPTAGQQPAAQTPAAGTPDARVSELLGRARAALGGAEKLSGVRSLSATGRLRRVSEGSDQSGQLQLDMLLPDRLKVSETLSLIAGVELTRTRALDGDAAWTDTDSRSGTSNASVMILPPKKSSQHSDAGQLKWMQAELARFALGLLLAEPSTLPLEFTHAGEAQAADGVAEVLDVKAANGMAMRLFLDKKTHRPLMLSYRGVPPRVSMSRTTATAKSKEEVDKLIKEKTSESPTAAPAAPQDSEIQLIFSDYRDVNGVLLPHRISKVAGGKVFEEMELTKYKLNPANLTARQFTKK